MKRNKGLVFTIVFMIPVMAAMIFCGLKISALSTRLDGLNQSAEVVEEFAASEHEETFKNEKAYEMFDKEVISVESDDKPLAVYNSPEGIYFKSYSEKWDEENLKGLYNELIQNEHGDEIETLLEVKVLAEEEESYLATHSSSTDTAKFYLKFPAIPNTFKIDFTRDVGIITLHGGDVRTTPESMASTLSHEYGHHYTMYYMFDDNENKHKDSEFVKIRGLQDDERVRYIRQYWTDDYDNFHRWYILEIAAEDYVALMGSPNTKTSADVFDVRQQLAGSKDSNREEVYNSKNAYPQENVWIQYAEDVSGLAEYFYGFIDKTPKRSTIEKKQIDISLKKTSRGFDLVGGKRYAVGYEVTWNTPYDEDVIYTLIVGDDEEGGAYPIKTVKSGGKGSAYIGCAASEGSKYVSFYDDTLASGTKTLVVSVMFPDGSVTMSDPLEYKFN